MLRQAMTDVQSGHCSLRWAARENGVNVTTLYRHLRKPFSTLARAAKPPMFSGVEEKIIADMLMMASDLMIGMTRPQLLSLPSPCAQEKGNVHVPPGLIH